MSATRVAKRIRRASSILVAVQVATGASEIPSAARLRRWARIAARGRTQVTLRVVGTAEARRLNREYRGRDYATDVLTFAYGRRPWLGDVVICHPVLVRAARERGVGVAAHYAHLVVHGMLHLRGYDHRRKSDALRMERAEARLLARIGCANPYAVESALPVRRGQQVRRRRRCGP